MIGGWSWLALVGLGAFHGLNPAMGWLFAVANGLYERSERALWRSLLPIAIGHEASVVAVVLAAALIGEAVAQRVLAIVAAVCLIGFGLFKLVARRSHPQWVGFRLSRVELAGWSLLMASAHGAGLMLLPIFTGGASVGHRDGPVPHVTDLLHPAALGTDLLALLVHVGAMMAAMTLIAVAVYRFVGLAILRRAWVNLERVWAVALVGAGIATLFA